ncbi:MAG: NUDIX hydrolase [Planctomycetota bacterium]|jgi:ADP-ribose pyrophosphatase YjhB (NUDIX family)
MPLITDAGSLKLITSIGVMRDGKVLLVDYKMPSKSRKQGWWIPTPEFDYGEHPERAVESALEELGLAGSPIRLTSVDSFVRGTGWHLVLHYRVDAAREPEPGETIRKVAWFGPADLPRAEAFANGEPERAMALRHLGVSADDAAPPPPASDEPVPRGSPRAA